MFDLIITVRDARSLGYCSRGIRAFCERHNLDYGDFIKNGIASDNLLATGDSMAQKVVEVARGRRRR